MNYPHMFSLEGKTALVSGGGKGLGLAISEALLSFGAKVIIACRDVDKAQHAVNNLLLKNHNIAMDNITIIPMDIAIENSIINAMSLIAKNGSKIDILINNASINIPTPISQADNANNFQQVINTNILGTWLLTQHVVEHMKKYHIAGSIINIGSINGHNYPYKNQSAYAVSKAAIEHMAKSLALELAPYHIRINNITPGPVKTNLYGAPFAHDPHFWQDKIPLNFIAEPSDLYGAVIYLSSNLASRYVTGTSIIVDGGISIRE